MNPDYLPGSIIGVQGGLLAELQYHLFEPQTHLYHFLVVRSRLQEEDDYEIIEMLGRGTAIGRLSWYDDSYYVVYQPADPEFPRLGKRAAKYASRYGRRNYDYGVFARLPLDLLICWSRQLLHEHRLRRIRPGELRLSANKSFICTELPVAIYSQVGMDPLAAGDAAIPPAYVQAELEGRLTVVDVHYPRARVKSVLRIQPCVT